MYVRHRHKQQLRHNCLKQTDNKGKGRKAKAESYETSKSVKIWPSYKDNQ
jgi:hypothetical protein